MLITHKLKKGETFATIMKKHGVTDWKKVWDLPQNKPLKAKRKTADQVAEGDTLTLFNPKARVYQLCFGGRDYLLSEDDFADAQRQIIANIRKKLLPRLTALKAAYDEDYEYMASLAADSGALIGFLAAAVENLSGAKVPTREMNAVSDAIKAVQKALNKEDPAACVAAMVTAEEAMDAYVKAAETYRKKMISASETGVTALVLTREASFIVLSALLSAGAGTVLRAGAFSSMEIGAASGILTGVVKAAAGEVGEAASGNSRSVGQIAYSVIKEAYFGAAGGVLSGFIRGSDMGDEVGKLLAGKLMKLAPKWAQAGAKARWYGGYQVSGTFEKLADETVAKVVAAVMLRVGTSAYLKTVLGVIGSKDHADECTKIIASALSSMSGKESLSKAAGLIADAFAESAALVDSVLGKVAETFGKAIDKELHKAMAQEAEAA